MTATHPSVTQATEPFVGDELISVVLATYAVELHFQRDVLQIGGHFTLSRPGHADEHFEPENRLGAVQALWPFIGRLVTSTHWGA